jgi:hypothetical protein
MISCFVYSVIPKIYANILQMQGLLWREYELAGSSDDSENVFISNKIMWHMAVSQNSLCSRSVVIEPLMG